VEAIPRDVNGQRKERLPMKKYKVWSQIEEIDDETGVCQNVSEPRELGVFRFRQTAEQFVEAVLMVANFGGGIPDLTPTQPVGGDPP